MAGRLSDRFFHYPQQQPLEFEWMCHHVRELQPRRVLEIGSRFGNSFLRLVEASLPGLVLATSIDKPGPFFGGESALVKLRKCVAQLKKRGIPVEHIIERSQDVDFERVFSEGLDFAFIDGSHTLAAVSQDYENVRAVMNPGGLIAFHDIANAQGHQVHRLWSSIKSQHPATTDERIRGHKQRGIGLLWLPDGGRVES